MQEPMRKTFDQCGECYTLLIPGKTNCCRQLFFITTGKQAYMHKIDTPLLENNRLICVDKNSVLCIRTYRVRQHTPFDIPALTC
jgi:hypothetical protein